MSASFQGLAGEASPFLQEDFFSKGQTRKLRGLFKLKQQGENTSQSSAGPSAG